MKLRLSSLVVVSLAAALSACGGNKSEAPKASQVIAKVNDSELSVHQLNFLLQGAANVPADRLAGVKKELLNRLVEQEAIVQEAISKKTDREPNVQQQLEAARREVLVRNYLQKIASSVSNPDPLAVEKFFSEKPFLFQNRKVYKFAEISLPGRPIAWPEIEKALLPAKTINEAATVLKAKGIDLPIVQNVVRGSEELPMDLIEKISKLKDGEVIIYPRPPGIAIAQIMSSQDAPVDQSKAKPLIERFLVNQSRNEAVQAEMKRIKDSAKVTLMGEFAAGAEAPKPIAAPAAPTPDATVIDKGVKSLK